MKLAWYFAGNPALKGFRDQLISASLKHTLVMNSAYGKCAFPRSADLGLIEAITTSAWFRSASRFRDQLISASLKLLHLSYPLCLNFAFPRSADLGLIEASRFIRGNGAAGAFPRSADLGLIEAWNRSTHRDNGMSFPGSADLGLIEASNRLVRLKNPRRFRDQLISASLKLSC